MMDNCKLLIYLAFIVVVAPLRTVVSVEYLLHTIPVLLSQLDSRVHRNNTTSLHIANSVTISIKTAVFFAFQIRAERRLRCGAGFLARRQPAVHLRDQSE